MCLLVWHQTIWTRSVQSLEPDFGLPANVSFPLSMQSRLVCTGTCYTVNTDGHQNHITNLLLTTGCYWFAPWPCPAQPALSKTMLKSSLKGNSLHQRCAKRVVLMKSFLPFHSVSYMPCLIDGISQIASKSHFENIPGVGCHSSQAFF